MRNLKAQQVTLEFEGKGFVVFKSKAEANRAKVLEILKWGEEILEWEYEPQFFRFYHPHIPEHMAGKSCGVRKYKVDFKVTEKDGKVHWEEIKNGYFVDKDKTKLKCMSTYYPDVRVWLMLASMPKGRSASAMYKLRMIHSIAPFVDRVYDMSHDFKRLGLK